MYTVINFKSKKELKAAVDRWNTQEAMKGNAALTVAAILVDKTLAVPARPVRYFQPGPFGGNEPLNGTFCVEGPHYPQPHKWYATCTAKDGVIIKVK